MGGCTNLLKPTQKISKDDFKVLKCVGRGSFGKVMLVEKKNSGDVYAMKILTKDVVAKRNLLIKTQAERDILEKIDSPFIVKLHYAFQTETKLYFVMDFCNGGELFFHLRKSNTFSERRAMFYTAQLVEAIRVLHENGIIYRDLKPENVLLDRQGNLKITDFGLSKQGVQTGTSGEKTYSFCGTPEYLAPEIIKGTGHDKAVDWWSLGALLYEMLRGRPPHYSKNRKQMLKDIVEKPVQIRGVSAEAEELLTKLLERNPQKRLGSHNDSEEIMAHSFFRSINWADLRKKMIKPPYTPNVASDRDTSNIDGMFTREKVDETPETGVLSGSKKKATNFKGFTYDED